MPTNRVYRVAVIPGDGIGKEVVPEGVRALEAVAKKFGFEVRQDWFDFASYDYYAKHERMMPEDWKEKIGQHDAIFFGAVGWPAKIPDHISLWGSLILFRREFDQYVNLRPVRLMPGVPSPLANRKPGDIDFWVVRENTEGEYSSIGGRAFPGTEREIVVQETVFTRIGVDRVLKFAFELAQKTPKKHLTSATKSNGIAITMPYWDERVEAMAKNFPDIKWDKYHIDILSALFVLKPDRFNVVVASNLFGDILSDLGPACTGTIGIAPSGNINPERKFPSVFEPVHGSAPDIAGQGIANPVGQIWSAAMMLEHLGESEAAAAIVKAIEQTLADAENAHARSRRHGRHRRGRQGGRRAPRLMAKPVALTKQQARRIWLRAQRLDEEAPFGGGPDATRAAVEHLGYVQIDTINVVERCHHQILYTRIPDYQREHLRQAQSVDKTVFEYWTHALSYVPTARHAVLRPRHEAGMAPAQRLVHVGEAGGPAQGAEPHPPQRPAHDPRHRRRRAGGQGPRMGEPQAVEACAATRLLSRRADGEPARGHAEDL